MSVPRPASPSASHSASPNSRYGFTLVELMVTGGVIALILALLIPAIQAIRHSATRTQCINNLHNLGLAFQHWKDVNDPKPFPTSSWVSELTRYMDNVKTQFNCPLDDMSWNLDDSLMYIRLYWGSRNNPLRIYDMATDRTWGENLENPQLNAGIVQIAKDQSVGIRSRQSFRFAIPASSPAGSWMAEFETTWATNNLGIGHALDWNDLFLLMEPQPNGSTKVTYFASDPVGGVGGNEIFDILDQNQNPVATSVLPLQYGFVPGNGRGISYGINSRTHDIATDYSTKVLLLEYRNTIARVVGPAPYNSDLAHYPANVRERHALQMNVMFGDGHVEQRTGTEIDPRDAMLAAKFWNP